MIKRLAVRNYKSLKDVAISFKPLTVLAGPNASGKTNILDSLSFICDLVSGRDPLKSRGGDFRLLAWGGHPEKVTITIRGTFPAPEKGQDDFEYHVGMKTLESRLFIEEERCLVVARQEPLFERKEPTKFTVFRHGMPNSEHGVYDYASALAHIPSDVPELAAIKSALSDCVFYDFIPWQMKQWQQIKRTERLEAAGANIAALLHTIQRAESPLYQNVLERLKAAIPRVQAIETDLTHEDTARTYVQLREKGIPEPIKSFGISEGTFRMLAIILALFSPNPARLVTIEGPETSVHPHLLHNVADNLISASEKVQVIVTTHSPQLLDHMPLESLIIVNMEDGATRCRRVKQTKGLEEAKRVLSHGELYYSGALGGTP